MCSCHHILYLFLLTNHLGLGPSWLWSYGSWIYNYLCNKCLSPLMSWVRIWIKVRCTILCDKVCQWLATGRWFSQGPPVSSTNKTDRHDIAEVLLKVALNTTKLNKTFGLVHSKEKIFEVSANQKQELSMTGTLFASGIFVEVLTNIIPARIGSNWLSSFREDNQNVKSLQTNRWRDGCQQNLLLLFKTRPWILVMA